METIEIKVLHFYNHQVLYPFMPASLFEILEDAYQHNQYLVEVPRDQYDYMIERYFDSLKN